VVDDEMPVAMMMVFLLSRAGFDAQAALSAEKAMRLAQTQVFDLITLDISMPGCNGFELLRRLRRIPHLQQPIVIFISGNATIEDQQRALDLGAADFIEKPFVAREFISRILFHARRERPASNFPDQNSNPNPQSLCNTP
jgi:DNA-binding response OmpR family regulator